MTHRAIARAKAVSLSPSDVSALEIHRQSDPGYYLISKGRTLFEKELNVRVPLGQRFLRLYISWATPSYLSSLALVTVLLLAIPLYLSSHSGMGTIALSVFALLGLIPASDMAVTSVNRVVMDSFGTASAA